MTRRSLTSLAAVTAAVVASTVLAGPVAAATPGKRVDAKRAAVAVKAPTVVGTAAKTVGRPLRDTPGMATAAECRAFAAAIDGIIDQIEDDVLTGNDPGYDQNAVIEGLQDAGQARGCVFMHG